MNYDDWLTEPYDRYYEDIDEELEEHLENLRAMDYEDDQRDYCEAYKLSFLEIEHHLKHWPVLGGGGWYNTNRFTWPRCTLKDT